MTIDIISYADEQFAGLTEEQILEVENVQMKKNRLSAALEENKRAEKFRLLEAGIYRSAVYDKICEALDAEYDREVENLRDGLLFYLRFTAKADEAEITPYTVDYSLTYAERLTVVKEYYNTTYPNTTEKFEAFRHDTVAPKYLGEFYTPLYELYASQA